ncbi:MAG: hypothetical protein M3Y86_05395 [Verrucomicrobiota bacterium]|nr:hypothetical protein [Verrucomicrobiota bacterium]
MTQIPGIPTEILKRFISPDFFKSLRVSQVDGWIEVRGDLVGTHLMGSRVIHSESDGAYDSVALDIAREIQLHGYNTIGFLNHVVPVRVHVFVYKIADGTMFLSFPTIDNAGGNQFRYYGCARLAVHKYDGEWVNLKGPPGLEGKGFMVRRGPADSIEDQSKLEKIVTNGFLPGG